MLANCLLGIWKARKPSREVGYCANIGHHPSVTRNCGNVKIFDTIFSVIWYIRKPADRELQNRDNPKWRFKRG